MKDFLNHSFGKKIKLFFFPILRNKLQTFLMVFYFTINASFGIVFLFFIQFGIDALQNENREEFTQIIYIFSGLFFCNFFLFFLFGKGGWPYSYNRFRKSIEEKFLPIYVQFDPNFQEKVGTGKTISIISKGIQTWATLLDRFFTEITLFCISIGVTLYFLFQVQVYLVFLFIFLLVFAQGFGIFINSFTVQIRKGRIELNTQWSREMVRIIMSKMEILQSYKIENEIEKLHIIHEKQIGFNIKMAPYMNSFFSIGHVFTFCILLFVFLYIGGQYFEGNISLGLASSTMSAILMMQRVFLSTLDFFKNFTKEFSEVEMMWDFFEEAPFLEGYETGNTFSYISGNIELQKLSYAYEGNKNVFENFDVRIQGGNITAFVGPSGGGKSTLVKLIAGYLKANSGEIIIDGQKLSETSLKTYYQDVGYLTQEPSVFDGTVRENLMYAIGEDYSKSYPNLNSLDTPHPNLLLKEKEQATNEIHFQPHFSPWEKIVGGQSGGENGMRTENEISQNFDLHLKHILKLSRCEFIDDLPQGLDTEIGERGVKLSGGQKQRLAIAKIFLKNPKIIILDEPTSALDSQSEKAITQAMHELFKERTVLVIAHRLQTVKYADEIIVIDSGKIIERGNHDSLVKQKGYYAEMLELQSGF